MIRLSFFEWKKIMKNKTTWIVTLLSVIAVIGIYFLQLENAKNLEKRTINQYDFLIDLYTGDVEYWEEAKEEALVAQENDLIEEASMRLEYANQQREKYISLKQSFMEEDWQPIYQEQVDKFDPYVNPSPDQPAAFLVFEDQEVTDFTKRASYEHFKYVKDYNVEPFTKDMASAYIFYPTIYDEFEGRSLELWQSSTKRYGKQGFYFTYQLIQSMYLMVIILLGCFILGNTISAESRTKQNNLAFYKTLPIHQTRLLLSKFITGFVGVLVFLVLMFLIPIITGAITHGWGSLDYPVLVYDGYTSESMRTNTVEDTFHFIPLKKYLLKTMTLSIIIGFLIYSIYFLISQFSKEPILNVIIVGVFSYLMMKQLHPINPFSYLDTDKIITQEIQLQTWNTNFSFVKGIGLNGSLGFVFLILNYIVFKYRSK